MGMRMAALAAAVAGVVEGAALPSAAQDGSAAVELMRLQVRDIDADHDGLATVGEFGGYSDLVMVSMDSDESGDLVEDDFTSWGFGMHNLADAAGTRQGYDTAKRVVFGY